MMYEEWIVGGNQIKAELDRVDAELQEIEFRLKLSMHKGDLEAATIIEEDRNQCLQEWQGLVLMLRDHKEIKPPKR